MTVERWRFGDDPALLVERLARGGILAVPTESSYGLAVDPWSETGVEAVYQVKGRERGKPLPVVAARLADLESLGIDADLPILERLGALWPAPLTVVLPLRAGALGPAAAAGAGSLAVRIPAMVELRGLLEVLGPLTATSANRSGELPVLDPVAAAELLAGRDALVVDGGRLPGGLPSTLVRWGRGGWEVLRSGRFPPSRLAAGEESPRPAGG